MPRVVTQNEVRHCIQVSGRLLPSRPPWLLKVRASFTKRSLVALTKLQGRIFVIEIWALAPDAPNVPPSRLAWRSSQRQSRRPGMEGNVSVIEAETFTMTGSPF
jgi:hypothetical protein